MHSHDPLSFANYAWQNQWWIGKRWTSYQSLHRCLLLRSSSNTLVQNKQTVTISRTCMNISLLLLVFLLTAGRYLPSRADISLRNSNSFLITGKILPSQTWLHPVSQRILYDRLWRWLWHFLKQEDFTHDKSHIEKDFKYLCEKMLL